MIQSIAIRNAIEEIKIFQTTLLHYSNCKLLQEPKQPENQGPPSKQLHEWTNVHCHYALMGGYVFEMQMQADGTLASENFVDGDRTSCTITTSGLLMLAKKETTLLPHISKDTI